jgi:hypothetical protein
MLRAGVFVVQALGLFVGQLHYPAGPVGEIESSGLNTRTQRMKKVKDFGEHGYAAAERTITFSTILISCMNGFPYRSVG